MTKSEERKLAAKKRGWDEDLRGFDRDARRIKCEIKRDWKFMLKWLFFYQSKDKGEQALHIFEILAVDLIILRVFGLI